MPAKSARAPLALLLSTALGCQEINALSKYDPLIRLDKPSNVQVASTTTPAPQSAATSTAQVHCVSYAPGDAANPAALSSAQPIASGGANGNGANVNGDGGATTSLLAASADAAKPSWLNDKTGPSGAAWNDLFVTRGQGPLSSVFTSDRTLMAAIVIAAIVIPFAVHDSRQPNPPHQ